MDIQVWSDVVCPWCYLGRHRLTAALARLSIPATVTYRAYQLDPAPVPRPVSAKAALAVKLGSAEGAEQMFAHVTTIAAGDGLALDFDRAVAANTFDAHRLIAWAAGQGRQAVMLDALQRAHFTGGVDVGDRFVLAGVAGSVGLDQNAALAFLQSPAGSDAVHADLHAAGELGITSVPTFVVDGRFVIQGAQEVPVLVDALREIARREAAPGV